MIQDYQAIVLAAGKGTRMNENNPSPIPKALYKVAGKSMTDWVLEKLAQVGLTKPILVIGYKAEMVEKAIGLRASYIVQEMQEGTGHAVRVALEKMPELVQHKGLFVVYVDMPLWRPQTFTKMMEIFERTKPALVLATVKFADPLGPAFGRIIRDKKGRIIKSVEQKMATPREQKIKECNAGLYLYDSRWLADNIGKVERTYGAEYPLTDLVGIAVAQSAKIKSIETDPSESIGINTLEHRDQAEALLKKLS